MKKMYLCKIRFSRLNTFSVLKNGKNMQDANYKMMKTNKQLIGIDLFAGAGGLSLGAEMAGISMRYAVEADAYAAASYKRNFKNATVFCEDIRKLSADKLNTQPVFIIMGGPPCQGFSLSNTKTRDMSNPNNRMFEEFLRFVDKIAPTWFVFENVYGLTKFKNGEENIQNHIENRFRDIGYTVKSKILYASDFGVPQRRNRLFIVGNRNGIDFEFPKEFDYSVSVDEAISDLPVLGNGEIQMKGEYTVPFEQASPYAQLMRKKSKAPTQNIVSRNKDYVVERYKYIGQGENWSSIPDRLMENYADRKETEIFRALAKQIAHFKSDVTTSMGLPVPFMSMFNLLQLGNIGEYDQTIAEIVQGMYYEGYDFIHFCSMSVPAMLVEVIVRIGYAFKRIGEGHTVKDSIPVSLNREKHPKLATMLFLGHSAATAVNAGKVAFTENPMAINYAQWIAFTKYSYSQLKWAIIEKTAMKDAYVTGKIYGELKEVFDEVDNTFEEYTRDKIVIYS